MNLICTTSTGYFTLITTTELDALTAIQTAPCVDGTYGPVHVLAPEVITYRDDTADVYASIIWPVGRRDSQQPKWVTVGRRETRRTMTAPSEIDKIMHAISDRIKRTTNRDEPEQEAFNIGA